jgi:hypothetical protein
MIPGPGLKSDGGIALNCVSRLDSRRLLLSHDPVSFSGPAQKSACLAVFSAEPICVQQSATRNQFKTPKRRKQLLLDHACLLFQMLLAQARNRDSSSSGMKGRRKPFVSMQALVKVQSMETVLASAKRNSRVNRARRVLQKSCANTVKAYSSPLGEKASQVKQKPADLVSDGGTAMLRQFARAAE